MFVTYNIACIRHTPWKFETS